MTRCPGFIKGCFIAGFTALLLFAWLVAGPAPLHARSRLKAVGYVDGYRQARKAAARDENLGYREFVARARKRLKRLEPYPRQYVKGFEEGARDFFRKRKMDHTKESVDFGLRPEGALDALDAPE
jgi:hypothetical protein